MNGHQHSANHPAVHGMLIFGDDPIYLSHLPMFHPVHALQLIIEVTFRGENDPAAVYRKDRATSMEKVYTWVPEKFVLEEIVNAAPGTMRMTGDIVRGHFERGGTSILTGVSCVVSRVIHSHPLSAAGPRDTALKYLLFGARDRAFAAHMISAPPDFDQVISVEGNPLPSDLPTIITVQQRPNDPMRRIQPGEQAVATDGCADVAIRCTGEFYFETGDLAS